MLQYGYQLEKKDKRKWPASKRGLHACKSRSFCSSSKVCINWNSQLEQLFMAAASTRRSSWSATLPSSALNWWACLKIGRGKGKNHQNKKINQDPQIVSYANWKQPGHWWGRHWSRSCCELIASERSEPENGWAFGGIEVNGVIEEFDRKDGHCCGRTAEKAATGGAPAPGPPSASADWRRWSCDCRGSGLWNSESN